MQRIAINAGNYNTKFKTGVRKDLFKTRIRTDILESPNFIIYDGIKYEIGEGTFDISNFKYDSLVNKLCTLYAIAKNTFDREIAITTCLPIQQYKDLNCRNKYRETLLGDYTVITEDGERKFKIVNNLVYMEVATVTHACPQIFDKQLITCISIGGYNVGFATFDNHHIIKETADDLDIGMYHLENSIKKDIDVMQNTHLKEYELKHIIQNPNSIQSKIIEYQIDKMLLEIQNRLKLNGINLYSPNTNLYFTGGGSNTLEKYLIKRFPKCLIGNIFDEVNGLWEVGAIQCKNA